jgi:hypothetical protein
MPRPGTMAADIEDFLSSKPGGGSLKEITEALGVVRRSPVLNHSVRSAIYQHLDGSGARLFVRLARGRYGLRGSG